MTRNQKISQLIAVSCNCSVFCRGKSSSNLKKQRCAQKKNCKSKILQKARENNFRVMHCACTVYRGATVNVIQSQHRKSVSSFTRLLYVRLHPQGPHSWQPGIRAFDEKQPTSMRAFHGKVSNIFHYVAVNRDNVHHPGYQRSKHQNAENKRKWSPVSKISKRSIESSVINIFRTVCRRYPH